MFTDGPVTPLHVESVIDFLRLNSKRKFSREDIKNSFQPESVAGSQEQITRALRASEELGLIEKDGKQVKLAPFKSSKLSTRQLLLSACDQRILSSKEQEYYFALFYAYLLGLNEEGIKTGTKLGEQWASSFNRDVFNNVKQTNQFNSEKYTGLMRWFSFVGLGWHDTNGAFNCNPYHRLSRALPQILAKKKLECDEFMESLAENCPELDGGEIFLEANKRYDSSAKQCTLGLSHALIDLHLDGQIKLHCPKDSNGWSIGLANPPSDGKTLVSARISQVELGKGGGK